MSGVQLALPTFLSSEDVSVDLWHATGQVLLPLIQTVGGPCILYSTSKSQEDFLCEGAG